MRKHKFILMLILVILISSMYSVAFAKNINNTGETKLKFDDMENGKEIAYTVGLMYYDIWKGTTWTAEGQPGDRVTEDDIYKFEFEKEVVSVKVYDFSEAQHMDLWNTVRPTQDYYKSIYPAVGQNVKVSSYKVYGQGTKAVTVIVNVDVTLEANVAAKKISKVEDGKNVIGLEYYMPLIFEVEFKGGETAEFKGGFSQGYGSSDCTKEYREENGFTVYNDMYLDMGTPLVNGKTFSTTFGPYKTYTEIWVYFMNNWSDVASWDEKKVKSTKPSEIIKLNPGEVKSTKEYTFTGTQYSGYDDSTIGVGYAVFSSDKEEELYPQTNGANHTLK